MVRTIVKDIFFLGQKSEPATKSNISVGKDLQDTLEVNRAGCVGMAANMIGIKKRVIIVNIGLVDVVMFNPVMLRKDTPYETEEGCLSLTGVRKTTTFCVSHRYVSRETKYIKSTVTIFKSNARETWHAILVSFADIYPTESLCILAERLS